MKKTLVTFHIFFGGDAKSLKFHIYFTFTSQLRLPTFQRLNSQVCPVATGYFIG